MMEIDEKLEASFSDDDKNHLKKVSMIGELLDDWELRTNPISPNAKMLASQCVTELVFDYKPAERKDVIDRYLSRMESGVLRDEEAAAYRAAIDVLQELKLKGLLEEGESESLSSDTDSNSDTANNSY